MVAAYQLISVQSAVFLLIATVCVCTVMQYDELVCESLLACTFDSSSCLILFSWKIKRLT